MLYTHWLFDLFKKMWGTRPSNLQILFQKFPSVDFHWCHRRLIQGTGAPIAVNALTTHTVNREIRLAGTASTRFIAYDTSFCRTRRTRRLHLEMSFTWFGRLSMKRQTTCDTLRLKVIKWKSSTYVSTHTLKLHYTAYSEITNAGSARYS